jgi:tetratricopeptide (TPR) repeat protein
MRNFLAKSLNDLGNSANNRQMRALARILYRSAATCVPSWSSPWYNLGLQAKYLSDWQESLSFNERAAALDPDDEASWWNLGIAATALKDWEKARRAWRACGIELEEGNAEVRTPPVTACVRLDPKGSGEVVWGTRIDPARIQIRNVPLPNSNHHYCDILLNDGAAEGTRMSGEFEYPVFNELAVWKSSSYSTFQSALAMTDSEAEHQLTQLCAENDVGFEDWTTVRIICAACSRTSLKQHSCSANEMQECQRKYGFAATSRETLVDILRSWTEGSAGRDFSDPHLVLLGG